MIRAARFEKPEYIPMSFVISNACYFTYPQDQLFELIESHRSLFPDFVRPKGPYVPRLHQNSIKGVSYTDDFGCVWKSAMDGIVGTVIGHPLSDWADFENYKPPDPKICDGSGPVDWDKIENNHREAKNKGLITSGSLKHGHTFLRLCDLRGYENVIYDMSDNEPKLYDLIEIVEGFNMYRVNKFVGFNVDIMKYPEDLGMQNSPMLSPDNFRKFIKPSYEKLMKPAREKGIIIHMHSDGYIRDFAKDIVSCGADIINIQDLVNGIDWIADEFGGKVCIDLDIDRQDITVRGTPEQIDKLIYDEVRKISKKEGGLIMTYGLYPGVPLENVKALMDAMEKYSLYYS